MSSHLKLLCITALSSAVLVSCSNEAAQIEPVSPAVESVTETAKAAEAEALKAVEKTAMAQEEAKAAAQLLKEQAMAKAKAEAADAKEKMMRAEETEAKMMADKKAKEAKEAMVRAEAQAAAAKNAAEQKAAKDAMAQAEAQRRATEAQQAALDAQRAQEAQIAREAQAAQDAQAIKEAQAAQQAAEQVETPPAAANPNAPYNAFLAKYVSSVNGINLVAYDQVTPADRAALRSYIEMLSTQDIEALPRDAEMATWFNLYNAKTIELILENYPTKSIRKISNPWKKDRLVVNGRKMSLDDIEHGTVRKKYNEPRVHYAFNCASIGCPNVKPTAWEAATLEADLVQASRDFVASERGVSVRDGKIVASSIFKWYKKDFGGNEAGVLAHLRQYASGSKKAALDAATKINKYDYDWDLNIQ